jgi:hypothetical protein
MKYTWFLISHIYLLHEKMNKNTQKNVLVLKVPPQVSHQQLEHWNNEIVTHQNESKRTQTQTQNVIGWKKIEGNY